MPSVTSNSGIRDNHTRGAVADFLKEKIRDGTRLSVVSAYFTIYAFDELKHILNRIDHLDFLFGEPSFVNRLDPSKTEKKAFIMDADGLELANKLQQKRVAKECSEWIDQKVDIKTIKQSNLLHGKMYHVATAGVEDAILGSSNFTVRGLGLGTGNNNIELNLIVDSNRDRQELKQWFDDLWLNEELVKDVKNEVLQYLRQLYENHGPEFIYYKTLFHIFENFLLDSGKTDADLGRTSLFETDTWKALFEFQKDGVKGAINKILRYNGCIIADSVGLGKTFEALAVIKYFELRNERVLVLCPKKLRENWTVYRIPSTLNPFLSDRYRYDVLSHTDLSRDSGMVGDIDLKTFLWGNYDLVVIDESHNFRNNAPGKRDEEGEIIRKSRYQRLMEEIIQKGVRTKVLLLSATPVNNDLKDLRNQIYFLTGGMENDGAYAENLGIGSVKDTLTAAQKVFTTWARKQSADRRTSDLMEKLSAAFFKLLDELTIARSRKHIQKYYKDTIALLGGFPIRNKPVSIYPEIDIEGQFLSYDKLSNEIDEYKLSLFNPSKYLQEKYLNQYKTSTHDPFTQAQREKYLIGMMKVNFLKRLESSVESFEITMGRTMAKIEGLEAKINAFLATASVEALDEVEVDTDLGDFGEVEDLDDDTQVGGKFKYKLAHLELDHGKNWLSDLKKDREQLKGLWEAAQNVTEGRDAKLAELKKLISAKVNSPTVNKLGQANRKVIVFTAFADTAKYLYGAISPWATTELGINVALVCGGGDLRTTFGKADFNEILTNFSPRSKKRDKIPTMLQVGEIDLLIATDCISEGQNLQDCDYLVNYDIHWNPVRIIQRFGRIDRIGSASHTVQLVNFWPTDDLNKYINLKNRVEARMALVDIAATFEDNILKSDEIEELIHDDLKYRDKQLLKLKDEVLDLEDLGDSVSLTEFTLDDFRLELLKYIEANRAKLEDAPFGLYTVVPPSPEHKTIAPGVIFCFRQKLPTPSGDKAAGSASDGINPLKPYFLVYVLDDGNVRFTFAQPKQVLEIYRILCSGTSEPYAELCDLFDQQTNHGADMKFYDGLLRKAVDSIAVTFRRRAASGLQSGRGFVLPDERDQVNENSELDLITWLVVKKHD
jgi:SNF2 family DNA or RNA helicase